MLRHPLVQALPDRALLDQGAAQHAGPGPTAAHHHRDLGRRLAFRRRHLLSMHFPQSHVRARYSRRFHRRGLRRLARHPARQEQHDHHDVGLPLQPGLRAAGPSCEPLLPRKPDPESYPGRHHGRFHILGREFLYQNDRRSEQRPARHYLLADGLPFRRGHQKDELHLDPAPDRHGPDLPAALEDQRPDSGRRGSQDDGHQHPRDADDRDPAFR